jgi:hypothetical protein
MSSIAIERERESRGEEVGKKEEESGGGVGLENSLNILPTMAIT